MNTRFRRMIGALALIPLVAVACTEGDTPAGPVLETAAEDGVGTTGHSAFQFTQHFIVCKEGTDATFDYDVVDRGTGAVLDQGTIAITDGSCATLAVWDATDPVKEITVTEQSGAYVLVGTSTQEYVGKDQPRTGGPIAGTSPTVTGPIGNDFGVVVTYTNAPLCTGEIGDFVWDDLNGDGLQDPGEPGIEGVTVKLLDAAGNLIQTAATDANGFYLFLGLCAGDYTVEVDEATLPAGYMQTPVLIGGDPTIDNNPSPFDVTLPTNDASDLTIDFGYMMPSVFEGCTPGYYKNLKKHAFAWTDAGYDPTQSVASVFSEAANAPYAHLGAATLHEGLSFQGGNSIDEAAEILLRAAIAAMLNADNPNVAYTFPSAQIVAAVNAALVSQDRDFIVTLAFILDRENNAGCPLGNDK